MRIQRGDGHELGEDRLPENAESLTCSKNYFHYKDVQPLNF